MKQKRQRVRKSISRRLMVFAFAMEVFGMSVVSAGIGVELATRADIGHVIITTGSLVMAGGGALFAKFLKGVK